MSRHGMELVDDEPRPTVLEEAAALEVAELELVAAIVMERGEDVEGVEATLPA